MKKFLIIFFVFSINFNLNSFGNENLNDIAEGNEGAKIKIFVYSSLTCPHCASFHNNIYPLLKKDFIDNGIVKIYFKHFPLDLAALNAAKILQCANKKNRLILLNHLYKNQEKWIQGKTIEEINKNLKNILTDLKISEVDFNKCLAMKDVEDFILNERIEAAKKHEINSTPSIIINDEKFKNAIEYKNLKKIIEKLI